jgi:20S proteasome alpha/beta subunit
MTLIIAIGCNNGIVMGSDSASSDPITGTKQAVKKIQQLGELPVVFGGAGDVGLIQKLEEELNDLEIPRSAKFKLTRRLVQEACLPDIRAARDNHVPHDAAGYDRPPTAILLFGCIHNKSPHIFEIEADGRDTVYDQNFGFFNAIGSGKALAQAIMRPYLQRERDLSLGKMLAYRILEDAIELSATGLAKPIHLYTLTLQGKFTQVENHELRRLRSQCELWHELEREVLEKLIAPSDHDESEIVLGPYPR